MIICDFCGRNQNQVKRMIEGKNGVSICDNCIKISMEVLESEKVIHNLSYDELKKEGNN